MKNFQMHFWIIYLTWATLFEGVFLASQWGENCPKECQCGISESSQILLSQWKYQRTPIKTAICIFPLKNLHNMLMLPFDTESFTFIQGSENVYIVLDGSITRTLQNLRNMEIQGISSDLKLYISNDIFLGMSELFSLSLQRVDLTKTEKAFLHLRSLQILQIVNCNIAYLTWEMLKGLSMLQEFYIVQSGLKEIYDFAFYGTPELKKLFLNHNELFSITADNFIGLLKLEHLDLSNNKIDHISGLTFPPLPHLKRLELKHNPVRVIFPHCFRFFNRTQHLTLGHSNQVVHLMKFSFRGLFSLVFLHIPNIDNDILSEHMFYDLQSLLHLNLQGRIKILDNNAFNGAHKSLQKLVLHKCLLEKVMPHTFNYLKQLTTLDLSSNLLKYFPERVFEPLKSLQELILSDNILKSLQNDLFFSLTKLEALRLDANPWNCTCDMVKWSKEKVTKMSHVIPPTCKNKSNPICEEYSTSYKTDPSLIPKCENPMIYRGEDVFDVVKKHLQCK